MNKILSQYGECDVTVDGDEAVEAYTMAVEDGGPYDLVCLDVMMPGLDGYQVLKTIRDMEKASGKGRAKVIMTSALNEENQGDQAVEAGCDAYVGKPLDVDKFEQTLRNLHLI